jgi:hypothetical protein
LARSTAGWNGHCGAGCAGRFVHSADASPRLMTPPALRSGRGGARSAAPAGRGCRAAD